MRKCFLNIQIFVQIKEEIVIYATELWVLLTLLIWWSFTDWCNVVV